MGCSTTKLRNPNKVETIDITQIRKPKDLEEEKKFWDDPQINNIRDKEQTVSSTENIFYYYKFGDKLGNGSFGSVCLGIPLKDPNKKVAIKTIQKSTLKDNLSIYIKREIDIFKSLDHPNICKFLETYMDRENIYVVMEYCSGGTLKELIYQRNNTESNVAKIVQKLFWAVNYLHHQKIVHRDLKLENVIFNNSDIENADVKIIDFGLSKKIKDESKRRHTKVGSYQYMAPEVIQNSKYDKECDVWSLGCIMFALLAGELPFYDINSIQTGSFRFNAPCWKVISKDAKSLIKQMLIVDTQQRITLEEAMKHSWFNQLRKQTLSTVLLPRQRGSKQVVLDRLFNYTQSSVFKREILLLMVKRLENYENQTPKEIFRMMNKENNGFISVKELKEVVEKLNLQGDQFKDIKALEELVKTISNKKEKKKKTNEPTKQEEQQQIKKKNKMEENYIECEKQNQLQINYSEFLAATLDDQYYLNTQKLNNIFRYLDSQDKNYVTKEDIVDMLAREGRKLPDSDLLDIYDEIKPFQNHEGQLTFEGFKNIMSKGVYKAVLNEVIEEVENISSHDNSSDYHSDEDGSKSSEEENNKKKSQ